MGFLLTVLKVGFKAVDVGLAVAQVVDNTATKVKYWKRARARKARLIKEIKKS